MSETGKVRKSRARPAWKRWALRVGIALAVIIAALLLVNGIVNWRAGRAIRAEVAAIRAAREPLNWDELARTDREGHVVEGDGPSPDSEISRTYAAAMAGAAEWGKGEGVGVYSSLRKAKKPAVEKAEALAESLKGFREALALFRKGATLKGQVVAAEVTRGDFERIMSRLSLIRMSGRMLSARALVAAARGRGDEAVEWCIALCRFAGAVPDETLISGLVSIAVRHVICETVESCQKWAPSSPAKTRELMAALAELETDAPMVRMLCGERVLGISIFQGGKYVGRAPKFFKRPNHAEYLLVMRKAISAARMPFPACLDEMDALVQRSKGRSGFFALVNQLTPALSAAFVKAGRAQAEVRVLRVWLALRCARTKGTGLPVNLEGLAPEYLEKVPLDPFSGKPMLYKRTDAGCLVYSVGDDRTDDGGAEPAAGKTRYGPGTDIVIELEK